MVDVIIIGGGPAGYHAALRASQAGLQTVLISKESVGGVCLHSGCIPSKTILYASSLTPSHEEYGIPGGSRAINLTSLHERVSRIVTTLERGISGQLEKSKVRLIENEAEILPKQDDLFVVKAGTEILTSRFMLLATGSKERSLEIPGIEHCTLITLNDLLGCTVIPQSLLVVGAGSIGLEMCTAFAKMGTQVTLVEQQSRIGSSYDPDLTRILEKELEKEGVTILLNSEISCFTAKTAEIIQNGQALSIPAKNVFFALGRVASSDCSGLHNCNVQIAENGNIIVDSFGETSESRCYAAGDVVGEPKLAHSAYNEAERVIDHILGRPVSPLRPLIPAVLYTSPELASVGISEKDAQIQGIPVIIKKRPLGGNGRFLAETSGERGVCKVVIHAENGQILGVHLAMPHASELIIAATIIVAQKLTASDLANCIFPHPTMGEIIKQCIVEET